MEFITTNFIQQHFREIADREGMELSFTPDALEFIRILLIPYATVIDTITDVGIIPSWISQTFEVDIVNLIIRFHLPEDHPVDLATGKEAIIKGILDEIVVQFIDIYDDLNEITAFDILEVFQSNPLRPI